MPPVFARFGRNASLLMALLIVTVLLAACGGGSDEPSGPTPTAMPMSGPATETSTATAIATAGATTASTPELIRPAASPVAQASPIPGASPIGNAVANAGGWTRSVTRDEFEQQLFATFPMDQASNRDGTVILGESSDISTLNPLLANDTLTFQIVGAVFETLVGGSPIDGQPVPGLADYWEVSPDFLTYVFHINRDARWHDGADVTAEDVKFSFDAALNPNTGSTYTTLYNENIAGYRIIDEHTFEVTARDRYVSFLQNGPASIFIVPKHIWESVSFAAWSVDGASNGTDPARVIGSGPFKFKEWVLGDHITLERNDAYYNGPANLAKVIFRVLPDTEGAVDALKAGETDVLEIIPAPDTAAIQQTGGLTVDIYDFYQMTLYLMNIDPKKTTLLQEVEVRQAMMMAIDRDSITENIFYGYGEAAVGTQPPLSPAYAPDQMTPTLAFDPNAARALLDSVGWRDTNDDGVLDRGGVKLKLSLIYATGDATTNQIVAFLQESWKSIGIDVELESMDFNAMVDRLEAKNFDLAFLAFSLASDGSQTSLFACDQYDAGLNFMRYCNQEWDRLDELQKREFDPEARTRLLIQQSQIVWQEQPVGVIRFGIARTGYSTTVHNFYPNGYGFLWSLPYMWSER
jgi:peptide/nickel transport system substrate-binding protein